MADLTPTEQKLRFARRFVDTKGDAIICAQACFPPGTDAVPIINAAREWPYDPEVLAEIKRINETPIEKGVITTEVLVIARSSFVEAKDRIAAYKLVAELNGLVIPVAASAKAGHGKDDKLAELAAMIVKPPKVAE